VPVVAALELEHPVAVRDRPREPHRGHRRLGPGRDEPYPLDRRHRVDDLRRELDLGLRRRAEARPVERGAAHRLDRLGIGVPEDQRPPRLHPVDERAAVGRLEEGAAAAFDEERLVQPDRAHRANRRVDAAGDQALGAVPELRAD